MMECIRRTMRATVLFYWSLLTMPRANMRFAASVLGCGGGIARKTVSVALFPFAPLWCFAWALCQGSNMWGEGSCWLARLLHTWYGALAYILGRFYCGEWQAEDHPAFLPDGTLFLNPFWGFDNKDFWRRVLMSSGVRVPSEIARWKDGSLQSKDAIAGQELFVKTVYGSIGSGDACFKHGTDYNDANDVFNLLAARGEAKEEALILQRVLPCASLGVHCLRIQTARTRGGKVVVLWTQLQINSGTWSSHDSKHRYSVDAETETVVGPDHWYRNSGNPGHDAAFVGKKLLGVRLAASAAIRAHENALRQVPSLAVIGWDAMFTVDRPTTLEGMVFFEGNLAWYRVPPIIFSSWTVLFRFICGFSLP